MRRKPDSEELLLTELCIKSDRKAQKKLYDKYKDSMYTTALRITGNEDDAAEALQDSFIQVFHSISKFMGKSTLGAWIKTITVRASLKKIKTQIKYEDLENVEKEIINWPDNTTGEVLEKAINQLNPGYRSVFVLTEVEGYKHKEVAEMLNISVGTSKSQLFHAKRVLKQKLTVLL